MCFICLLVESATLLHALWSLVSSQARLIMIAWRWYGMVCARFCCLNNSSTIEKQINCNKADVVEYWWAQLWGNCCMLAMVLHFTHKISCIGCTIPVSQMPMTLSSLIPFCILADLIFWQRGSRLWRSVTTNLRELLWMSLGLARRGIIVKAEMTEWWFANEWGFWRQPWSVLKVLNISFSKLWNIPPNLMEFLWALNVSTAGPLEKKEMFAFVIGL